MIGATRQCEFEDQMRQQKGIGASCKTSQSPQQRGRRDVGREASVRGAIAQRLRTADVLLGGKERERSMLQSGA